MQFPKVLPTLDDGHLIAKAVLFRWKRLQPAAYSEELKKFLS
jgi:hypothetical protein